MIQNDRLTCVSPLFQPAFPIPGSAVSVPTFLSLQLSRKCQSFSLSLSSTLISILLGTIVETSLVPPR